MRLVSQAPYRASGGDLLVQLKGSPRSGYKIWEIHRQIADYYTVPDMRQTKEAGNAPEMQLLSEARVPRLLSIQVRCHCLSRGCKSFGSLEHPERVMGT
jgi:hypothetical protein